jgi:shikimate dehydrogenase
MQITGKTKLLGVIGEPIAHSLSPVMHNAALNHLGLDYIYLPFPVKPEALSRAIEWFRVIDLQGFNITIPHKQTIMPLLAEISSTAQLVGAVNTVYQTPQGWAGTNTDVQGFIAPLKNLRDWRGTEVLVLGYGGAARAVVVGCQQLGCKQIHVVGRNPEKLRDFHQSWADFPGLVSIHPWGQLANLLPHADLVVNTTPIGTTPDINISPVELSAMMGLKSGAIAYDLIYNPSKTLFLQQAEQAGAMIFNGLEMLVQQGAAALEIWLGCPVPIAVMQQSLANYQGLPTMVKALQ